MRAFGTGDDVYNAGNKTLSLTTLESAMTTFQEGANVLIISPHFRQRRYTRNRSDAGSKRTSKEKLDEAEALALALRWNILKSTVMNISVPSKAHLFASGNLLQLQELAYDYQPDALYIDAEITPTQQRNLQSLIGGIPVYDRVGVILDIFAKRANTREAQVQVELARLQYESSRLVIEDHSFEQQRGGGAFMAGGGEKAIELARRRISDRMAQLRRMLSTIQRTRHLHRERRNQEDTIPSIALVGYSNVGKSLLAQRLTNCSDAEKAFHTHDELFHTLDSTVRKVMLPSGAQCRLIDTVGFISDLPHELIASFRATLQEVCDADVLIHVRDGSSQQGDAQRADVLHVLKQIGISVEHMKSEMFIEVINKSDCLLLSGDENVSDTKNTLGVPTADHKVSLHPMYKHATNTIPKFISALTGQGIEDLKQQLDQLVLSMTEQKIIRLALPYEDPYDRRAWLYQHQGRTDVSVVNETPSSDGKRSVLEIRMTPRAIAHFQNTFNCNLQSSNNLST